MHNIPLPVISSSGTEEGSWVGDRSNIKRCNEISARSLFGDDGDEWSGKRSVFTYMGEKFRWNVIFLREKTVNYTAITDIRAMKPHVMEAVPTHGP